MSGAEPSVQYRFGRFELQPAERRLLAAQAPVPLGPHAFDLLVTLVQRSGQLVTKDELLTRVWGHVIVGENALQAHISSLRKVLGADAIATVSGRGYRFALDVSAITAPAADVPKHNLPYALTSFIGREAELADLHRLISRVRLLTLTGAGGCGKSRLAVQLAHQRLHAHVDGACLVELAALSDPTLLERVVAAALGVKDKPDTPLVDAIAEQLKPRALLLLLDNAEHLLEPCAHLSETLLRRCPRLVVLVTSRERLRVTGELSYPVPSLSVPAWEDNTPASVGASESAQLFLDRVRLHEPGFEITHGNATAIASLCRRLDGIALALELMAARARSLSVEELSRRVDQRFEVLTEGSRTALPRHRTLRALIDWSHDLLGDAERAMLRRVSVFAGGWTLEAATKVCCGQPIAEGTASALELLTSLVDKSLVVADTRSEKTRYTLLETVRQYASERLHENSESDRTRDKHLAYLGGLARYLSGKKDLGRSTEWLDELDLEFDNIRAALGWSLTPGGDTRTGLRAASDLEWFWLLRHFPEGRAWMGRLLDAVPPVEHDADRARALGIASKMALAVDDHANAQALGEQALAACRRVNYLSGIGGVLDTLGHVARERGQLSEAIALYRQSLETRRADPATHPSVIAVSLMSLGIAATASGDLASARLWLDESVAILRRQGDWRVASALCHLGKAHLLLEHDLAKAKVCLNASLQAGRDVGVPWLVESSLVLLGVIAHEEDDTDRACRLLREALSIVLRDVESPLLRCEALDVFAGVAHPRYGGLPSARLWGATQRRREESSIPRESSWRPWDERQMATARPAAGDEAFDQAWTEGRQMSVDDALVYALGLDAVGGVAGNVNP